MDRTQKTEAFLVLKNGLKMNRQTERYRFEKYRANCHVASWHVCKAARAYETANCYEKKNEKKYCALLIYVLH